MFKDLPPAYIGKLVTYFNKDIVMPKEEDDERNISFVLISLSVFLEFLSFASPPCWLTTQKPANP
jgi:hypothetical protein